MPEILENKIKSALESLGFPRALFVVEHAAEDGHGDYASNVALVVSKTVGKNPRQVADEIVSKLKEANIPDVEKIEVAGPGFINFFLTKDYYSRVLNTILEKGNDYGRGNSLVGKKVMVEYTDPNVMKPFHIGHLMTNAIGESVSRLCEVGGAEVKRTNYYSDAGLAIAKAVWGMTDLQKDMPAETDDIVRRTDFLGKAYAHGVTVAEEKAEVANVVKEINKKIYDRSDEKINQLYDLGKRWSLEHFELLYKKLGSSFDYFIAETSVAPEGLDIVHKNVGKVFDESEGAVVFAGDKRDSSLHTRVFVNKEGLPTYEAKELALNKWKYATYHFDQSLVFTANEQNDYFRVVLRAIAELWPEIAERTKHFGHGMLRLPSGKMSSRTGNVITGESLIADVEELARKKMESSTHLAKDEQESVATDIAVGAIKYSILKQGIGKDIIFDFEKSLSFEGDSGPYLQYTFARTSSLLSKGEITKPSALDVSDGIEIVRLLERFPFEASRALAEYAPHRICTYLIEVASAFNSYYANTKIIDPEHKEISEHRLALTQAVSHVLKNGLWLLGIRAPEKI